MSDAVAEVIQSSTTLFVCQCYELDCAPPLGSVVRASAGPIEVMAAVSMAETSSIDSGRRPVAIGDGKQTFEDIKQSNPHLAQLFTTSFQAIVVGYRAGDDYFRYLPPMPVPIHTPVYLCNNQEIAEFTSSLTFLDLIYSASTSPLREELLAAFIRTAGRARGEDGEFLAQAGRQAVVLMRKEPAQLWRLLEMLKS